MNANVEQETNAGTDPVAERRMAVLQIELRLASDMMKAVRGTMPRTYQVIKNALPDDAAFVRSFYGPWTAESAPTLCLVIASSSFEAVGEDEMMPVLPSPEVRVFDVELETTPALPI